ncbi:MAG: hypothetical protein IJQ67_05420 [Bacilli bacterium]|nr:hypothetical protein [Bacilli bacterium]
MSKYDEIINLPHHQSLNHKKMSNLDRAAQFAPFAALNGYSALIREMARITQQKITLSHDKVEDINKKLSFLKEHLKEKIEVELIYFKKDEKKEGGEYLLEKGYLSVIDEYHRYIRINTLYIKFSDIYSIEGDIFNHYFE